MKPSKHEYIMDSCKPTILKIRDFKNMSGRVKDPQSEPNMFIKWAESLTGIHLFFKQFDMKITY